MTSLDETQAEHGEPTRLGPPVRGALVGRYVVLEPLGHGAMGVVVAAYDPDLDRKVALKLLRAPDDASADPLSNRRLLREAQALARLSHPNVVAVHDVGLAAGQVFLAMEFVEGRTVAQWLREKPPWPRVLDVFVRAGRGLAAAHSRGLVHRDFKPDNVMLGADGRVRVMDFGVALAKDSGASEEPRDEALASSASELGARIAEAATEHGRLVGTPAYMAPEQFFRLPLDAATDQFSYCVALWEGLYGVRPFRGETLAQLSFSVTQGNLTEPPTGSGVPTWVRRVLERGLRVDAAARHPSMDALLDALGRDPSRPRRRAAMLGAAILGLAGAFGGVRVAESRRLAACRAEADAIWDVWSADRAADVRGALVATGVPYAEKTAELVLPRIHAQVDAWRTTRASLCDADPPLDPSTRALAIACLDDVRASLDAVVGVLADADPAAAANAAIAVSTLPTAQPCVDPGHLARRAPLPTDLETRARVVDALHELRRAGTLANAGREADAVSVLESLSVEAEAIGWAPLAARVEGRLARARTYSREGDQERALRAAFQSALRIGEDALTAEAAGFLAHVVGVVRARPDEGIVWDEIRTALNARMGLDPDADPLVADQLSDRGLIERVAGRYDAAIEYHSRALAIRERVLGPDHPDVAFSLGNLGICESDRGNVAAATRYLERALALFETLLGPEHPRVATALNDLAAVHWRNGDAAGALPGFRRALELRERALGPDHYLVGRALANVGSVLRGLGEHERAVAMHERAVRILARALGPEHPDVGSIHVLLGDAHHSGGRFAEALDHFRTAEAILEKALGADHPQLGSALQGSADALLELHEPAEAVAVLERARRILERTLTPDSLQLAAVEASLSQAHEKLGDRPRAVAHAISALAIRTRVLGLADRSTKQRLKRLEELARPRR